MSLWTSSILLRLEIVARANATTWAASGPGILGPLGKPNVREIGETGLCL